MPLRGLSLLRRVAMYAIATIIPAFVGAQPFARTTTIGHVDSLQSTVLDEKRRFLVYLPRSYRDTIRTPRSYPVLYLLDGDGHFQSVSGVLRMLAEGVNGTFVIPEMIVIAVPNTNRTRDLTPTRSLRNPAGSNESAFAASGGGPKFLEYLKEELIPRVEKDYRTAPYRAFVGHSFGGITVINALYTMPETFNAYVAIDPSLWWDDRTLLKQAKAFFARPAPPGRALFVAQANTSDPADSTLNPHFGSIIQFNSLLKAENRSGIRYAYKYYPDDSHGSVPLIATYDALRFLFPDHPLDLAKAIRSSTYLQDHFAAVSRSMGYSVPPPEMMVELLARNADQIDSSRTLPLFELNVALYPGSAAAHSGLGDGWLAKGDTAKAKAAFEKALSLQAGLRHPSDMLKRLAEKKP